MTPIESLLRDLLLFGLLPLWLAAGFADYLCHRHQRIEHSAGWRESLLHLVMLVELGIGVVAALLLEVTAAVLGLLLLCCLAHEVTMWVDLSYASARRRIPAIEQWVHSLQLASPWAGLVGLALLHADQARAALGADGRSADWALRWKDPPLPPVYLLAVLLAAVVFVLLPFLHEWHRARRAAREAGLPATAPRLSSSSATKGTA